jgi:hypothetical protein
LLWLNRPPVAIAEVSNVTFDSSTWPNATDVKSVCMTPHGLDQWAWHGVPNAKVTVTLDGSSSYDPDAGDRLIYAWNLAAPRDQPKAFLSLPVGLLGGVVVNLVAGFAPHDEPHAGSGRVVERCCGPDTDFTSLAFFA